MIRKHRKWILVSGDDDGHIYILRPTTEAVNDFSPYEKTVLINTNAQTAGKFFCFAYIERLYHLYAFIKGKPAVADLNGDGYSDIIAPGYSAGKIYVFTYAPVV